jgi:hypothetical protein
MEKKTTLPTSATQNYLEKEFNLLGGGERDSTEKQ